MQCEEEDNYSVCNSCGDDTFDGTVSFGDRVVEFEEFADADGEDDQGGESREELEDAEELLEEVVEFGIVEAGHEAGHFDGSFEVVPLSCVRCLM